MRAGRLGWKHVVDDATLIYHVRSASFGDAKNDLMIKGRAVIDARYPDYAVAIRAFSSGAELQVARERVLAATAATNIGKETVKPRILYVLSTRTGGTPQTNQDLMLALGDRIEAFVLRCNSSRLTLMYFQDGAYVDMEIHVLKEPIKAFPHRSDEYDAVVATWLVQYAIELVHIRHIAWHGLGLVDVSKALGLPVVFSFHDFYTVCPTVKLLDAEDQYCGGKCTPSAGQCRHELWGEANFPALKGAAIQEWRMQFSSILKQCDLFVTTAASAKEILTTTYEFLADRIFYVIPHGRDFDNFEQLASPIKKDETIRLLIPGNISKAKGGEIISELGRKAVEAGIELHILGAVARDVDVTAGVTCHGVYERHQFAERVRAIKPHIGGVFSIWPETYCHTLTELWACGVPVVGFDFGAVGDRIRESAAGWLAPAPTAQGVLQIIERLRTNPAEHRDKLEEVKQWQAGTASKHDCQFMSHSYYDLYRAVMVGASKREGLFRRAADETGLLADI
jgi:glycosyltransferase involved in cell wall biosynthesis